MTLNGHQPIALQMDEDTHTETIVISRNAKFWGGNFGIAIQLVAQRTNEYCLGCVLFIRMTIL